MAPRGWQDGEHSASPSLRNLSITEVQRVGHALMYLGSTCFVALSFFGFDSFFFFKLPRYRIEGRLLAQQGDFETEQAEDKGCSFALFVNFNIETGERK